MQRATQPASATGASAMALPATAPSVHAKTSAVGAVQAAPSAAKGVAAVPSTTTTTPRKALQPLDSNRPLSASVAQPPPGAAKAVAKAPFAYVSRFSRPLPSASTHATTTATPTTTTATTAALTGLKRKYETQPTQIKPPPPKQATKPASAVDGEAEADPGEQQRRENVAWLDMLVALLERKYQAYAPPVCVEDLERARMLDAYWPRKSAVHGSATPATGGGATASEPASSGVKRSRLSLSTAASATAASEGVLSHDEKEEKRAQALRRHAQQIQDTSVSSTSCCGCKTGCLKMYCVCFSTRGYCHDGCSCDNCKNSRASADQRLEAITTYLTNDPRAFSYAAAVPGQATHGSAGGSGAGSAGFFQLLPEKSSTVVLRGCRCKKSKCLKKYCECFQNGLGCGPHCRCVDCANDASVAARELREKNSSDAATSATAAAGATAAAAGGSANAGSASGSGGGFHAIKVAVTKKPRRNYVLKSVRLRL